MRILLLVLSTALSISGIGQTIEKIESGRVGLPNGWSLTPVGKSITLGDLPLNIAVSSSKRLMAVTNNGQSTQSIQLIDVNREQVIDDIVIPKSWYGLQFSADEKYLYASGGNDNVILKYAIVKNKLTIRDSIRIGKPWPNKISPSGIAIDDARHLLYIVTKENNSLYIVDLLTKKITGTVPLGGEGYACLLSADKKELYISCWGCDKVVIYNTVKHAIDHTINVGDNPNELCMTRSGRYLFVANANDNSVSVIDIKKRKVLETLNAALFPNSAPGSTTNGVALSADEKTLYIANADNNLL
jgi:YVTN family beta-propeller protein